MRRTATAKNFIFGNESTKIQKETAQRIPGAQESQNDIQSSKLALVVFFFGTTNKGISPEMLKNCNEIMKGHGIRTYNATKVENKRDDAKTPHKFAINFYNIDSNKRTSLKQAGQEILNYYKQTERSR